MPQSGADSPGNLQGFFFLEGSPEAGAGGRGGHAVSWRREDRARGGEGRGRHLACQVTSILYKTQDSRTVVALVAMSSSPTLPAFRPLYDQIRALLIQSLESGEWKPGEAIPPEPDLAARFGVSQGTVRKAIDALAADNLLLRRQGKGTFVATHHEDRVHFRFLRLVPDNGEPHYPKSKILDCKRLRAPAEIAKLLDLKAGDAVVQIERILFFSEEATVYEEIWLPGTTFKGLTTERLVEWRGPMYALFETEFATHMVRATERLRAVGADELSAKHLGIEINTPLLAVERVSFTYGERPVEVRKAVYLTSTHHYLNELN